MRKLVAHTFLFTLFAMLAFAAEPCPVTLLSGAAGPDDFSVTLRNRGKHAIRMLELNCLPTHRRAAQSSCAEHNVFFLPGNEYTVQYPYPGRKPGAVTISLKSALLDDGSTWKPLKRERCRTLVIQPEIRRR